MRKISASELGAFLYCQRAWFYARQGENSKNQNIMDLGSRVHQSHARRVRKSELLRWAAKGLFALGILFLLWSLIS